MKCVRPNLPNITLKKKAWAENAKYSMSYTKYDDLDTHNTAGLGKCIKWGRADFHEVMECQTVHLWPPTFRPVFKQG